MNIAVSKILDAVLLWYKHNDSASLLYFVMLIWVRDDYPYWERRQN
jgi:hypothetical protein